MADRYSRDLAEHYAAMEENISKGRILGPRLAGHVGKRPKFLPIYYKGTWSNLKLEIILQDGYSLKEMKWDSSSKKFENEDEMGASKEIVLAYSGNGRPKLLLQDFYDVIDRYKSKYKFIFIFVEVFDERETISYSNVVARAVEVPVVHFFLRPILKKEGGSAKNPFKWLPPYLLPKEELKELLKFRRLVTIYPKKP